jgi:hypothetical protein
MRQMIAAIGIVVVMLLGVGLTRPAGAGTQNSAPQKTATCTLQVTGMT